jgi:hypothetical protein
MHTVYVYTIQVIKKESMFQHVDTNWILKDILWYVIFNMPKSETIKDTIRKDCRSELCYKGTILKDFWLLSSFHPV